MIPPEELKKIIENAEVEIESVADFASALAPQLVPFVIIGKAVGKLMPDLVSSVDAWLMGNPPTQQEKDDLASKISALSDPNLP